MCTFKPWLWPYCFPTKSQFPYCEYYGFCYFSGWWILSWHIVLSCDMFVNLKKVKTRLLFSKESLLFNYPGYAKLMVLCNIWPEHTRINKKQKCVFCFEYFSLDSLKKFCKLFDSGTWPTYKKIHVTNCNTRKCWYTLRDEYFVWLGTLFCWCESS